MIEFLHWLWGALDLVSEKNFITEGGLGIGALSTLSSPQWCHYHYCSFQHDDLCIV